MKKTITPVFLILLAGIALAQCQTYTQLADGNYTPDTNGSYSFCDFQDLNKLEADYNGIKDQNVITLIDNAIQASMENLTKDLNSKLNDVNKTMQTSIQSTKNELTGKLDAQKNTTDQIKEQVDSTSKKVEAISSDAKQAVKDVLDPVAGTISDTKTAVDSIKTDQTTNNQNTQQKMDNFQTNILIALGITVIVMLAFLITRDLLKRKKKQEANDFPEFQQKIKIEQNPNTEQETPFLLKRMQKNNQAGITIAKDEADMMAEEPETQRIPKIRKQEGEWVEALLNNYTDKEPDKKHPTAKKKTTETVQKTEKPLPKTQEELNKELDQISAGETPQ